MLNNPSLYCGWRDYVRIYSAGWFGGSESPAGIGHRVIDARAAVAGVIIGPEDISGVTVFWGTSKLEGQRKLTTIWAAIDVVSLGARVFVDR